MSFIRNAWYVAAWSHEIEAGKPVARRLLNEPVVLYRETNGKVVALEDRCAHRLAPLSVGRQEGDNLRCMYHGLLFNPSGKCVEVPGQATVQPGLCVKSYRLVERDMFVWIWMGEEALADESLIVDLHWQGDPAWRQIPGYFHFKSNYLLIADNLLDFSHLSFVHENSLGGPVTIAHTRPVIEKTDDYVKVTRHYPNTVIPPFMKPLAPFPAPVDRWQIYKWTVCGNVFVMDTGIAPQGTGALEGHRIPNHLAFVSIQCITPETDKTSHFFHTYSHSYKADDPSVTKYLFDQLCVGFEEDKFIIEEQQKVLNEAPDYPMQPIVHDTALGYLRWRVGEILKSEAKGPAKAAAE